MGTTLVLGARGLIGQKLLPLLRQAGIAVKTAGRSDADMYFDWADPSTFKPALSGARVLYLVPPAMVASPAPQVEELLGIAKDLGLARVVAISSLGVTFPTEPADSGRHSYEEVIRASGIDWSILRPSGFMQNFSEGFMLPAIQQASIIASAAASGKVAMIDSGDIASVAVDLLLRDGHIGRTFEVTGPQAHDFAEMAAMISNAAGRAIRYQPVEEEQMGQMMRGANVPADYSAMLLRDQKAIREGHAAVVTATVQEITGREPNSFEAFVQANASAWR